MLLTAVTRFIRVLQMPSICFHFLLSSPSTSSRVFFLEEKRDRPRDCSHMRAIASCFVWFLPWEFRGEHHPPILWLLYKIKVFWRNTQMGNFYRIGLGWNLEIYAPLCMILRYLLVKFIWSEYHWKPDFENLTFYYYYFCLILIKIS